MLERLKQTDWSKEQTEKTISEEERLTYEAGPDPDNSIFEEAVEKPRVGSRSGLPTDSIPTIT